MGFSEPTVESNTSVDLQQQIKSVCYTDDGIDPKMVAFYLYGLATTKNEARFGNAIDIILGAVNGVESSVRARIVATVYQIYQHFGFTGTTIRTKTSLDKLMTIEVIQLAISECFCPCRQPGVVWEKPSMQYWLYPGSSVPLVFKSDNIGIAARCLGCIGSPSDPDVVRFLSHLGCTVKVLDKFRDVHLPEHVVENVWLLNDVNLLELLPFVPMNPRIGTVLVEAGVCFRNTGITPRYSDFWTQPKCVSTSRTAPPPDIRDRWIRPDVAIAMMSNSYIDGRDRQVILESAPTLPALLNALFTLEQQGIDIFVRNFYYLTDYICNKRLYPVQDTNLRGLVRNKIIDVLDAFDVSLRDASTTPDARDKICRVISNAFHNVDINPYHDHPAYQWVSENANMLLLVSGTGCSLNPSINECDQNFSGLSDRRVRAGNIYPLNHSKISARKEVVLVDRLVMIKPAPGTWTARFFLMCLFGNSSEDSMKRWYKQINITGPELQALCDIHLDGLQLNTKYTKYDDLVDKVFDVFNGADFVFAAIAIIALRRRDLALLKSLVHRRGNVVRPIDLSRDLILDVVRSFDEDTWEFIQTNCTLFDMRGSLPVFEMCPHPETLANLLLTCLLFKYVDDFEKIAAALAELPDDLMVDLAVGWYEIPPAVFARMQPYYIGDNERIVRIVAKLINEIGEPFTSAKYIAECVTSFLTGTPLCVVKQ